MIREKITPKDFFRIAKEHDYFVWHFLQKEQHLNTMEISSIIDFKKEGNPIIQVFENLDVPYFESYTEDGLDFLMGLGFKYEHLYHSKLTASYVPPNFRFGPIMIGFKKFTKISSTMDSCYCLDGVIQVISKLDSKYLEQIINNLEKNPE